MNIQLKEQGLFYTIEQTPIEYARVAIIEDNMSFIQINIEQLKLSNTNTIHLNIKKKTKYLKDRVCTLSYICRSFNNDNEAVVDEYDIPE
jgi:hypothetical protein